MGTRKAQREGRAGPTVAREQPAAAPAAPAWVRWGLPALIVAAVFAAFWPCLGQGFVAWDDDRNFLANELWKGFGAQNLAWMWTATHVGHWHPLTWMSLALDFELAGGVSAERIHLTNVILHAACALAVYALSWRLLAAARPGVLAHPAWLRAAAAAGALFFAVHPLRVESVAWATERRDVLSGALLAASVLAWLVRVGGGGARWLLLALLAFAASLLSKAWGITLPAVLLALDYFPLRRNVHRSFGSLVREKWPFILIAIAGAWKAASAQSEMLAVVSVAEHGLWQRITQACYGLCFYVWKTVWPSGLSPLYILEREFDPLRTVYLAAVGAVAAAAIAGCALRRRIPGWVCAFACYAIIASPVLGILQSGAQKVADRYTYLACIPFAVLFAAGVELAVRPAPVLRILAAALLASLPVLGALTNRQTRVWSDSETLWRRVIAVEPESYIGQFNLSVTLSRAADQAPSPAERTRLLDAAIEHTRLSIQSHPLKGNEDARYSLGYLLVRKGDVDGALAAWKETLEVEPRHPQALQELYREYLRRRDFGAAERALRRAIELEPRNLQARDLLAQLFMAQNQPERAREVLAQSLAVEPRWTPALRALGALNLALGRPADAEPLLRSALAVDPYHVETWVVLGEALLARGEREEAQRVLEQALALHPNHPKARVLLERARAGG